MAKLSVLTAFLLVALIALGQASAKRTVVTTTIVDDNDASTSKEQCEGQISMEKMRPCMTLLSDKSTNGEGNPMPKQLEACCTQLEKVDMECRCDAIQMMMTRQQEKGKWKGQQMQQIMQEAKQLPGTCGISPKQCQFQTLWVQTY